MKNPIMSSASYRNTINPIILQEEEWLRISDYIYGIWPIYWVSNYGSIYSENIRALLKYDYVGKGYLKVTLQSCNGPIDLLIHRIVMLCFNPIQDPESYTVNHKDGNHENNFYKNLEWATYSEQMIHASNENLINREGYQEDEIRRICSELELTPNQDEVIINIYGDIKKTDYKKYIKIKHLVNRIQRGQSWRNISFQYNIIGKQSVNPNQVLTELDINLICQILQGYGRDIPTRDIYNLIGIDIGNPGEKQYIRYMSTMVNIRNKKCFHEITSKYNF